MCGHIHPNPGTGSNNEAYHQCINIRDLNWLSFSTISNIKIITTPQSQSNRIKRCLENNDFDKYICDTIQTDICSNRSCCYFTEEEFKDNLRKNNYDITDSHEHQKHGPTLQWTYKHA